MTASAVISRWGFGHFRASRARVVRRTPRLGGLVGRRKPARWQTRKRVENSPLDRQKFAVNRNLRCRGQWQRELSEGT